MASSPHDRDGGRSSGQKETAQDEVQLFPPVPPPLSLPASATPEGFGKRWWRASWRASQHWLEIVGYIAMLAGVILTALQYTGHLQPGAAELAGITVVLASAVLILLLRLKAGAEALERVEREKRISAEEGRDKARAALNKIASSFVMPDTWQPALRRTWGALEEAFGRWLESERGRKCEHDTLTDLVIATGWPINRATGALRPDRDYGDLTAFCRAILPVDPKDTILAERHRARGPGNEPPFEEDLGQLKRDLIWAAQHLDADPAVTAAVVSDLRPVNRRTLRLVLHLQMALRRRTRPSGPPGTGLQALVHLAGHLLDDPACYYAPERQLKPPR